MRVPIIAICLLAAAATAGAPAYAHDAAAARHPLLSWRPTAWRPAAWRSAPVPAIAAGMRVEIDPVTGEFVTPDPTHFPTEVVVPGSRTAGLTVVTRPDGSRFVRVGDRLRKWSVVSVGPEGTLEQDCLNSEAEAIAPARARATSSVKGGR